LRVTVAEPPRKAHICACQGCQRRTGSAFSYNSFFADEAVTVTGERKAWRGTTDSGRWNESYFCPTCGSAVFMKLEALPGITAVSTGCFADRDMPAPEKLWWSEHRHPWLALDIPMTDKQ
jgi:hypothetical protein